MSADTCACGHSKAMHFDEASCAYHWYLNGTKKDPCGCAEFRPQANPHRQPSGSTVRPMTGGGGDTTRIATDALAKLGEVK